MKKVIIISIALILIVVGFGVYKYTSDDSKPDSPFDKIVLKDKRTDDIDGVVLDKDKYAERIINDNVTSINYNFFDDKESITGKIYIDEDKNLYISDTNKKTNHKVSTVRFKTMYAKDSEYKNIYVHLISEDNELYFMILNENDIFSSQVIKLDLDMKVTNFVDVEFDNDMYGSSRAVFVLTVDGKIYDTTSLLRYNEGIKAIFNTLYVFKDNTMSNTSGLMLKDKNGKDYKIKYVFLAQEDTEFIKKDTVVVVTDENEFIYVDKNLDSIYEFNKKVEDVNFDIYYPYINGNLKITFEEDYNLELKARCNQFYCINEFTE